ncbi:MAG TPA: hypothetical protein VES02_01675, partial [Dermatophilaceae bacterium]|nr:hypothetical protein [Dermatophilaceae bacterium]
MSRLHCATVRSSFESALHRALPALARGGRKVPVGGGRDGQDERGRKQRTEDDQRQGHGIATEHPDQRATSPATPAWVAPITAAAVPARSPWRPRAIADALPAMNPIRNRITHRAARIPSTPPTP